MKKTLFLKPVLSLALLSGFYLISCTGKATSTNNAQSSVESNALAAQSNDANAQESASVEADGFVKLPVTEHFTYVARNFITAYGTVKNTSGKWLNNVRLLIDLYDAQGNKLHAENFIEENLRSEASDDVICDITCVPPGMEIPFEYLRELKRVKGNYARHQIRAVGKIGEKSEEVILSDISVQKDGSWQTFNGTATVTGHCKWPYVAAIGYDAGGKIVAFRTYSIYLKPGAKAMDPSYDEMSAGQKGYFNGNMDSPTDDDNRPLAQIATMKFIGYYSCESN